MKSFTVISALLACAFLNNSGQAGRFETPDGQFSWEYDHTKKTAKLRATKDDKEFPIAQNIKAYGRWDKEVNQLFVMLNNGPVGMVNTPQMKGLPCVVEDYLNGKRLRVTQKEPGQEEGWEHYIHLPNLESQGYDLLVEDYFERTGVFDSEPTGETGFLCKNATNYKFPGTRLRWKHTIVDGKAYNYVEKSQRKSIVSAEPTETKKVLGIYVEPNVGSDERIKDEAAITTGCPSHPTHGQLGSYNNPKCLRKYPSKEEFLAGLKKS